MPDCGQPGCAVGIEAADLARSVEGEETFGQVGRVLQSTGSYYLLFLVPPLAYFFALGIIHVLSPRLQPLAAIDLVEAKR